MAASLTRLADLPAEPGVYAMMGGESAASRYPAYIGIGEKVEDLREFDAEEFVAALYEDADEPRAA